MHCGLRGWGRGRGVQAIRETEHFGKNLGCHLKQIYFWKPPDKFARAHGVDGVGYSSINEPSHRQEPIFVLFIPDRRLLDMISESLFVLFLTFLGKAFWQVQTRGCGYRGDFQRCFITYLDWGSWGYKQSRKQNPLERPAPIFQTHDFRKVVKSVCPRPPDLIILVSFHNYCPWTCFPHSHSFCFQTIGEFFWGRAFDLSTAFVNVGTCNSLLR